MFEGEAGDLRPIHPAAMAFVGDTSPAGRLLETAVGAWKMSALGVALGAEVVVVNTGGLVRGPYGRRLKLAKADLIRPSLVIVLERGAELEHLAQALEGRGFAVVRLSVAAEVRAKRPEERRRWRELRFQAYFAGAGVVELETSCLMISGRSLGGGPRLSEEECDGLQAELGVPILYGERQGEEVYAVAAEPPAGALPAQVRLAPASSFRRLLCGLIDRQGVCLALGLVEDWSRERLRVLTPLAAQRTAEVVALEVGELALDEQLREWRPTIPWARPVP